MNVDISPHFVIPLSSFFRVAHTLSTTLLELDGMAIRGQAKLEPELKINCFSNI